MNNKTKIKRRIKAISLISIFLLSGTYAFILMNFSDSSLFNIKEIKNEDDKTTKDFENPKSSIFGTDLWWNPDWPYRILINVTNQETVDLKNYGVEVVFPYGDAEFSDKVNSSLKDVRIIEFADDIGYEREFFIFQDFPSVGEATIYFNTNVTAGSTPDTDTYLYFGNMDVESTAVKEGLGLVKNGNFEYVPAGDDPVGDPGVTPYSYDPVGWNWSNNVPNNVLPYGDVDEDSPYDDTESIPTEYFQNALVDTYMGTTIVKEGEYSYKWGTTETSTPEAREDILRGTDEYAGVLWSNAFVVPIVGDGDPLVDKIYLHIWRNIRVCGFDAFKNDIDGYFVRVINASEGVGATPDDHERLGDYLEIYIGGGNNERFSVLRNFTGGTELGSGYTFAGSPTPPYNYLSSPDGTLFDLSNYMGENISLEIGMFGSEGVLDVGFGQVDEIYFTYQVDTSLNELQTQKSEITVITRDVDGNIVPNAEVSIVQGTTVVDTQTTGDTGEYIFTNMNFGIYNFTVNYTLSLGVEDVVFNSTDTNFGTSLWNIYNATNLSETFILDIDLWTIDFKIVDWDDDPLNDGNVKVYDQKGGNLLKTMQLVNGSAEFRWRNVSKYYYEVYFDNTDYATTNILLNSSNIYRSTYEANSRIYNHDPILVNEANIGSGGFFNVSEYVYTNGTRTEFELKKLIKANITLSNMVDQIDNVSVYYIDKNNKTIGNKIYENLTYSGEQSDFIELDIRLLDIEDNDVRTLVNDKLKGEKYDAFGLLIVVQGTNSTICNGIITVDTLEKSYIFNKTALSKMHIRIINVPGAGDWTQYPIAGVSIIITNQSNPVTTLTTYEAGNGWASHEINTYKPFIYLIGHSYNISLKKDGFDMDFDVNFTDPASYNFSSVNIYNYTLNMNSTIILDIDLSGAPADPQTLITEISSDTYATWGENVTLTVNISSSVDGNPPWTLIPIEGTIECAVKSWSTGEIIFTEELIPGAGYANYSITINSSRIPAGNDFEQYWFIITGIISGYQNPPELYIAARIYTKPTELVLVDYNTHQAILEVSKEFGELVNITVKFYNQSDNPLQGAQITFDWLALPIKNFQQDPLNLNYYFVTINTSEALNVGKKLITIQASLTNYSTQTLHSTLDVLERPTTINGESGLSYLSSKVWVEDPNPFEFIFQDTITEENIGNLTTATYTWEELYPNGSRIPGVFGTGILTQNGDNIHTLDFHTELKSIGFYYLYVTLHRENYKAKSALINLEIMSREFNYTMPTEKIVDDIFTIRNGDPLDLDITLHDITRDIPLQNAIISMVYQNKSYTFSEGVNGFYSLEITDYTRLTEDETSTTSTTGIIISKANFTTQIIDLTILLNNRRFGMSFSEEFRDYLIKVVSGDRLSFDITLNDSFDESLITDGTVTIFIGGVVYEDLSIINNGDGTYTITFLSYPEAFTSSKTLSGEIIIQKANYKTERIPITIEIKMTEIFPGMPTFYFILITASIIGILGSAVAYRVIQQARIPNHVKKIRKVKGLIKSKKKIEEIISVPTKEQMIAKLFGNDWKEIGLSLDETLGIQDLKSKKLQLKDKISKKGGVD